MTKREMKQSPTTAKRKPADDPKWERYFRYLDRLRDSGTTNMWGASPYLVKRFGIDDKTARAALVAWMQSFSKG